MDNLAKDKNLKVKWNDTTVVTVENELKKSRIKVIKEDKEDNKIKLKNEFIVRYIMFIGFSLVLLKIKSRDLIRLLKNFK